MSEFSDEIAFRKNCKTNYIVMLQLFAFQSAIGQSEEMQCIMGLLSMCSNTSWHFSHTKKSKYCAVETHYMLNLK